MLVDAIQTEQYSVETATNYTEAWQALATKHFKLAVLDITLVDADPKNEDGLRLLADIGEAGLDTNVIIVTGYGSEQRRETADRSPKLLGFLDKKEFNLPYYRACVRLAVEGVEPSQASHTQQ